MQKAPRGRDFSFSLGGMSHFSLLSQIIRQVNPPGGRKIRVLDIGGGDGRYWNDRPLIDVRNAVELHSVDLIEPDEGFVGVFHQGDALEFLRASKSLEFDVVVAFDLIEHLPKHVGWSLLYEMERVSGQARGVYTPNGFVWQSPAEENPWNAHISEWTPRDLRVFGFRKIFGHIGPKFLFGPYSHPRHLGNFLESNVAKSELIVSKFPRTAFAFSAWRLGAPRGYE